MALITFADKLNNSTSGLAINKKVRDVDMNEIKNVVNANAQELTDLGVEVTDFKEIAGAVPLMYTYSNVVTEADPGPGVFRFDFINHLSASDLFISKEDMTLDTLGLWGLVSVGSYIYIKTRNDQQGGGLYIVGTITDNSTWFKFGIAAVDGGTLTDGDVCAIQFFSASGSSGGIPTLTTRTGSTIVFDDYSEYNAVAPITSGNITINPSGAVAGSYVGFYFNGATEPTISGATGALESGSFLTGQLNIYHFFWNTNGKYVLNIQNSGVALTQLTTPTIEAVAGDTLIDLTFSNIDANATTNVLDKSTDNINFSNVAGYNGTDLTYQDTGLTNGQVYYYRFKSQAAGYIDSDYGTDNETPAAGFAFGNALKVLSGEKVTFTTVSMTGNFGIGVWFKVTSFASQNVILYGPANTSYISIKNATTIDIAVAGSVAAFTFPAMSVDTWYCLNVGRNSNFVLSYLNGVASTTGPLTKSGNFDISQISGFSGAEFIGVIDECGLDDGFGLQPSDATAFYNSGLGESILNVFPSPDVVYDCNESTGLVLDDSSGNTNDGTLTGFVGDDSQWITH